MSINLLPVEPFQSPPYDLPSGKLLNVDPFMNREAWLEARRSHVGASEVSALLSINPYLSAIELYARKIGKVPENIENDAMLWGTMKEDVVSRWLVAKGGYEILPSPGSVESLQCPFMSCTPDRIARDKDGVLYLVEVKTSARGAGWDEDGPPLYHQVQLQVNMDCTGIHKGILVGEIGGQPPVWFHYDYNERLALLYRKLVVDFWVENVQKLVPPTVDGSESAARALSALYPVETGETRTLPREAARLHARRMEIIAAKAALDAEYREVGNGLKALIGEAERGIFIPEPGEALEPFAYTYKTVNTKEHLVAAHSERQLRKVKV